MTLYAGNIGTVDLDSLFETERTRLVRLCARLTDNIDVAEDLVQETYIEAWRHLNTIYDPQGLSAWLSAIARNVCRRWWQRQSPKHARLTALSNFETDQSALTMIDDFDIELELERSELAALLDRALALLPPETHAVLVQKYIEEQPQSEIAARLGISEGTLKVRLHRGKLALRRVLTTNFQQEAAEYGVNPPSSESLQPTRLWCPLCGQHRMMGRLPQDGGEFILRCPVCHAEPGVFNSQSENLPIFAGVKGYKATMIKFVTWIDSQFRPRLHAPTLNCIHCGHETTLHRYLPDYAPPSVREKRGVHFACESCGKASYVSLDGLVLNTPAGLNFARENPRIQTLPPAPLEFEGRAALRICVQSLASANYLDIITDQTSYEILAYFRDGDSDA